MKSWLTNGVLVALSIVVVAVGTEALLRRFPRLMPLEARMRAGWMHPPQMPTVGDPYIGYLYPPNYRGRVHAGEIDFEYSTDEHGFRNPSPWPERADVVAIGDSETFGFGVDDDSTWLRVLARRHPGLRVINLGIPGMAPEEYVRIYEKYGVGLRPKLVLFGLFPRNDVQDEENFDEWLAAGAKGNYDEWKLFKGTDEGVTGTLKSLAQRTDLYWLVRVGVGGLVVRGATESLVFPDHERILLEPWYQDRAAEAVRRGDPRFERVLAIIEHARDLATSGGARFVVLLFPTKEDVYMPLRGESIAPMIQPFVAALDSLGIRHLDLTGPMQDRAMGSEPLFFEMDGHPNAAGSRVIAEAESKELEGHAVYGVGDPRTPTRSCGECTVSKTGRTVRTALRPAVPKP